MASSPPPMDNNLLHNPGFEWGNTHWSASPSGGIFVINMSGSGAAHSGAGDGVKIGAGWGTFTQVF